MDISISICVRLMDKCISIMAIPLYVPEGVGPVTDANNNSTNILQNNVHHNGNNGHQIEYTVNSVPSSVPVQVHLDHSAPNHRPVSISSFPHQLIAELYAFYQNHMLGEERRAQGEVRSNQRNMTSSASLFPSPSMNSALPDIITCHSGISLDVTFEASSVLRGGPLVLANNNSAQTDGSRARFNSNNSSLNNPSNNGPHDDDDGMELLAREDWTLELKLLVGPWRQTGIELRAIADQLELENARRRPLPTRRIRSIKVRLIANMALPVAALVAAGIVWFRRR